MYYISSFHAKTRRAKNLSVTRHLLKDLFPNLPVPRELESIEAYQAANYKADNWRDLYINFFSLSSEQADTAGKVWSKYQDKSDVFVEFFEGIPDVIKRFERIPHGICSQNCKNNIIEYLREYNLAHHFQSIIGHNEIEYTEQKPSPVGFVRCIENMSLVNETMNFVYIGDHEKDVQFAKNAEQNLKIHYKDAKVWSIAASYSGSKPSRWSIKPDYIANSVSDIVKFVAELNDGP